MKLVHYPNNSLHTENLKCSECSIIFSSVATQLDLPQGYTACTIHLQKEQLFIFREGTYTFSSNNPAEKEILCKIFTFEGKLEDEIYFPQINKKVPEGKYDLSYAYSDFENNILHLTFYSTTWQIGDFGTAYDLRSRKHGEAHTVR